MRSILRALGAIAILAASISGTLGSEFQVQPRDLEKRFNTLVVAYRISSPITSRGCDSYGVCDYDLAPGLTITLTPGKDGGSSRALIFYAAESSAASADLIDAIYALSLVLSSEVSAAELKAATIALFPKGVMPALTEAVAGDLYMTMTTKGGFLVNIAPVTRR